MPKKGGASKEQVDRIKADSAKGMSANAIQRDLQAHHMGMKRQKLLGYVREFKGRKPKSEPSKYTPTKYRKKPRKPTKVVRRRAPRGKHVAVYGKVDGESKRIQMHGSGRELYKAMMLASQHPPKKQFLTIKATNITGNPDKYLDMEKTWDQKEVES